MTERSPISGVRIMEFFIVLVAITALAGFAFYRGWLAADRPYIDNDMHR